VTCGPFPGWMMVTVTSLLFAWARVSGEKRSVRSRVMVKRTDEGEIIIIFALLEYFE